MSRRLKLENKKKHINKMGNILKTDQSSSSKDFSEDLLSVKDFKFHGFFEENSDSTNGLCLNDVYLPEEVLQSILSFIDVREVLRYTLVCKKWCNIIKSDRFWHDHYNNVEYPKKSKMWPWYVLYSYFTTENFKNLVKNGNGQQEFKNWHIMQNGGDQFVIENPPAGSDPLPMNISEFNGSTSCFATSFGRCQKIQEIPLKKKMLLRYILYHHSPHVYVSEWTSGRFDCACVYKLTITGFSENQLIFSDSKTTHVDQWQGRKWEKVEIVVQDNTSDLTTLIFEHEGKDTQFWKGHYGSKMAGGVVRFLLDSITPKEEELDE